MQPRSVIYGYDPTPPYVVSSQQIQIKVAQNRLKKKKTPSTPSSETPPHPTPPPLIDSQADTSLFALNSISAKLISQSAGVRRMEWHWWGGVRRRCLSLQCSAGREWHYGDDRHRRRGGAYSILRKGTELMLTSLRLTCLIAPPGARVGIWSRITVLRPGYRELQQP